MSLEKKVAALQPWLGGVERAALAAILGVAAWLRLANLAWVPGYYSDEGTLLNIAANLAQGKVQYLAITKSTLLVAKLPLFLGLLALVMKSGLQGIEAIRALTGSLGVVAVFLLYWFVRQTDAPGRRWLALVAALALAVYPEAVLYSRTGFSYNLAACLFLLAAIGFWRYLARERPGGLALAAAAIGLGLVSEVITVTLLPPFLLIASLRRWRGLAASVPLLCLPAALYAGAMLATEPEAFLFDLRFTASRLSTVPWVLQPMTASANYVRLLSESGWATLGVVGLFALRPARFRNLSLLLFLSPFLSMARTINGLNRLGFYYLIPLFPFVALGAAAVVTYGARHVSVATSEALAGAFRRWRWTPADPGSERLRRLLPAAGSAVVLSVLIVIPMLLLALAGVQRAYGGYYSRMDWVLVNATSARQVADYVNAHVQPDDLVLASPALAWMFRANVADFQQSLAASGKKSAHFPRDVPADRFAFDPDYRRARLVVVDPIWRNWAAHNIPEVATMLQSVRQWPVVYRAGNVAVYRNPAWQPGAAAPPQRRPAGPRGETSTE